MLPAPPSRRDNPFATCWTRPGAIPFLPAGGPSVDGVLAAWSRSGRRGQIVGPHGVGKSTLMTAVGDALAESGGDVRRIVYRRDERRPAHGSLLDPPAPGREAVVLIDGLEQLGWWRRERLLRRCRQGRLGVLATTHRPLGAGQRLPVLATLAATARLVRSLHRWLCRDGSSPVTESHAVEVFTACGGDVRELWFRLYDLHESLTRNAAPLDGARTNRAPQA